MYHRELLELVGEWRMYAVTVFGDVWAPRMMMARDGQSHQRWRFTDRDTGREWLVWPQDIALADA